MKPILCTTDTGKQWTVPNMAGTYPTFPANETDKDKTQIIVDFITINKGIKNKELVQELLHNQLIEAVNNDYIIWNWNSQSSSTTRSYSATSSTTSSPTTQQSMINYSKQTKSYMQEAPDLTKPTDTYF